MQKKRERNIKESLEDKKKGKRPIKKKRMKKRKCKIKILFNDGFYIECESVLRRKMVIQINHVRENKYQRCILHSPSA